MNHDVDFSIIRNGASATVVFPSTSSDTGSNLQFESRAICQCVACKELPNESLMCVTCGACYFADYDASNSDRHYEFAVGDDQPLPLRHGKLQWVCNMCINMMTSNKCRTMFQVFNTVQPVCSPVESLPSSSNVLAMIEKVNNKLCQMEQANADTFSDMQKQLTELKTNTVINAPETNDFHSPERKRKVPATAWEPIPPNANPPVSSSFQLPLINANVNSSKTLGNAFIKLTKETCKSAIKLLNEEGSAAPVFSSKINTDGATRLLFHSYSDAEKNMW